MIVITTLILISLSTIGYIFFKNKKSTKTIYKVDLILDQALSEKSIYKVNLIHNKDVVPKRHKSYIKSYVI
ncbi:MAG: hypothetical protein A2Y40_03650 [Candidatus Margulisbacteria bacterium GWF2_35_9]|nr:MAG: hypothetical protein A2Y40_03650 [Candidatus Margulisbacteria bacterium GWF2_35_9]